MSSNNTPSMTRMSIMAKIENSIIATTNIPRKIVTNIHTNVKTAVDQVIFAVKEMDEKKQASKLFVETTNDLISRFRRTTLNLMTRIPFTKSMFEDSSSQSVEPSVRTENVENIASNGANEAE